MLLLSTSQSVILNRIILLSDTFMIANLFVFVLFFALSVNGSYVNTTDFWKATVQAKFMHYQCYSGTYFKTKAMRK